MNRRFLLTALFALFLAASASAQVETWKIDSNHTASQFAVRHLAISTVRGQFTKTSGTVSYDPRDPAKTVIDVTIEAASVDTRVEARDKDLRSANFFDVEKYPTLTFKSTRTVAAGPGKLKITGDLTIHGVTREVVLEVEGPTDLIKDPRGNLHMGALATTKINRKDFGVNGAPGVVGDDIAITIDAELVRPAAPPQ